MGSTTYARANVNAKCFVFLFVVGNLKMSHS